MGNFAGQQPMQRQAPQMNPFLSALLSSGGPQIMQQMQGMVRPQGPANTYQDAHTVQQNPFFQGEVGGVFQQLQNLGSNPFVTSRQGVRNLADQLTGGAVQGSDEWWNKAQGLIGQARNASEFNDLRNIFRTQVSPGIGMQMGPEANRIWERFNGMQYGQQMQPMGVEPQSLVNPLMAMGGNMPVLKAEMPTDYTPILNRGAHPNQAGILQSNPAQTMATQPLPMQKAQTAMMPTVPKRNAFGGML